MNSKECLEKEKLEKLFKKELAKGDYPSITMSILSRLAMDSLNIYENKKIEISKEELI